MSSTKVNFLLNIMRISVLIGLLVKMIWYVKSKGRKKEKQEESSSQKSKVDLAEIKWVNSNDYYHYDLESNLNKKVAIKQLILKILQLSTEREPWDSIILDKWIFSSGRLIGNVQCQNEAVGMDRDYRVALTFNEYSDGLTLVENNEKKYESTLEKYNNELEKLIFEILDEPEFLEKLQPFHDKNPFVIEVCEQGERIGITINIS